MISSFSIPAEQYAPLFMLVSDEECSSFDSTAKFHCDGEKDGLSEWIVIHRRPLSFVRVHDLSGNTLSVIRAFHMEDDV